MEWPEGSVHLGDDGEYEIVHQAAEDYSSTIPLEVPIFLVCCILVVVMTWYLLSG